MALQRGFEDGQLAQSVRELRIFGLRSRLPDRSVEAAEDLLECVVVAFAVAAGKVGVAAGGGLQQRRIFNDDLIAAIAMADPQFVGTFLIPGDGRSWCRRFQC